MTLAVLCNNGVAIPTLSALHSNGIRFSVAIPEAVTDETRAITGFLDSIGKKATTISRLKTEKDLRQWILAVKPDAAWVMTFPYMIPESLLYEVPMGWFNFHFAPLPEYRGAEPLFWLIRNGEAFSAVTVHKMTSKADAGEIVIKEKFPIDEKDTHGVLLTKSAWATPGVAQVLLSMMAKFGRFVPGSKQDSESAGSYPRPGLEDVTIQWESMTAEEILRLIRACNPWNKGAVSFVDNRPMKIAEAHLFKGDAGATETGRIRVQEGKVLIRTIDDKHICLDVITSEDGIFSALRYHELYGLDGKLVVNRPYKVSLT